ncbi:hypothetical protein ACFL1G_08685 [Planctomycetota bacterium]
MSIFSLVWPFVYMSFLICFLWLLGRLVRAVEHIARKIESSFKT